MPKHQDSKTEQACSDVPQMEENKMAKYRKLSRTSDQRKALLRNQVTNLLYHGKIVTTEAKAKEIRKIAKSLIAMAVREKDNFGTLFLLILSRKAQTKLNIYKSLGLKLVTYT